MQENSDQLSRSNQPNIVGLESYRSQIGLDVLFVLLTCGIYGFFWQYRQMQFFNQMAGRQRFSFLKWLFFSFITCGLYHLYHEYVMASEIIDLQEKHRFTKSDGLPILSVAIGVISLGLVADAIQQLEINKIIDRFLNNAQGNVQ